MNGRIFDEFNRLFGDLLHACHAWVVALLVDVVEVDAGDGIVRTDFMDGIVDFRLEARIEHEEYARIRKPAL